MRCLDIDVFDSLILTVKVPAYKYPWFLKPDVLLPPECCYKKCTARMK